MPVSYSTQNPTWRTPSGPGAARSVQTAWPSGCSRCPAAAADRTGPHQRASRVVGWARAWARRSTKTWLAPMVWARWVLAAMASTRCRHARGVGGGSPSQAATYRAAGLSRRPVRLPPSVGADRGEGVQPAFRPQPVQAGPCRREGGEQHCGELAGGQGPVLDQEGGDDLVAGGEVMQVGQHVQPGGSTSSRGMCSLPRSGRSPYKGLSGSSTSSWLSRHRRPTCADAPSLVPSPRRPCAWG